jgi:hypothetical protein
MLKVPTVIARISRLVRRTSADGRFAPKRFPAVLRHKVIELFPDIQCILVSSVIDDSQTGIADLLRARQ